jgi:serine phosphatase RsbU (regulator of sigma subunit)
VEPEAKLRAVLELSRTLGDTLAPDELPPKILEGLFAIFPQAYRGFVLLGDPAAGPLTPKAFRHRGGRGGTPPAVSRTVIDHALATGRAVLSTDAALDERFRESDSVQGLRLRSVMCVPMLSARGAPLGVIQLDTRDAQEPFGPEDLDVLLCAGTQAARAVELAALHQEQSDREAAARIQQNFLPDQRPKVAGLQFFDHYTPAQYVGGDYFDYINLPGNRLAVALGDVSGKGVPAALLMARLSADARFCLAAAPSVPEAVRRLNVTMARALGDARFITFLVAVLDLSHFGVTVVSAGHPLPLRRRAGGAVESVGEGAVGLPLAGFDQPYRETAVTLEPGESLVLYTDGLTEARGPGGEFYGAERLREVVRDAPADVEALGSAILADVRQFAAGRPQRDDLTLVCVGRDP